MTATELKLVRSKNPAFIEIEDYHGDDDSWRNVVCDGCGGRWNDPHQVAYFVHNVRNNEFYLTHGNKCDELLRQKLLEQGDFAPANK